MHTVTYITIWRPISQVQSYSPEEIENAYQSTEIAFEEGSTKGELTSPEVNQRLSRMVQEVLDMNPWHLKTLDLKARLNVTLGNAQGALKVIKEIKDNMPSHSLSFFALATQIDVLVRLNQIKEALVEADMLLKHQHALPEDELVYVFKSKAQALYNLKREVEARVVMELSKLTPDAVENAYQIVWSEFKKTSEYEMLAIPLLIYETIFRMIEDILIVDSKHLKTLELAARVYDIIGDSKMALEVIKKIDHLTIYGQATQAHVYLSLKQFKPALQETDEILKHGLDTNEMVYVLETRAQALYDLGRITEALGVIQELKKLSPDAAERILLSEGKVSYL